MKKAPSFSGNQIMYVALLIAAFFLGYFYGTNKALQSGTTPTQQPTQQAAQAQQQPQPTQGKVQVGNGNFPALGNANAKVTIVEFADFQCPYCEQLFKGALATIQKDYIDTGKAKMYYRNYAFLGQESTWAAEAAYCANEQNQFWKFHDYLFSHQGPENSGTFTKAHLEQFAADLGLNTSQFNNCLENDKYKSQVDKDMQDGQQAGVTGTPAVFINGTMVVGAQPYSTFQTLIDKELK